MDEKQRDRLEVKAEVENLDIVTEFVADKVRFLDYSVKEMTQMMIVSEELFVNIASYAYNPEIGMASLETEIDREDNSIEITFVDSGMPYNPLETKEPDITLPLEKRKKGGLGVFFAKKKVDSMTYVHEDGKNKLTIKKKFRGDSQEND